MEFDVKMLAIFVPLVLYLISLFVFRNFKQEPIAKKKTSAFQLLFLIAFTLQILTMVTFAEGDWSQNDFYLYRTFYSRVRAMERFGVNKYVERDVQIFLGQLLRSSSQDDINMIDSYLNTKEMNRTENSYTGLFEGKNLIYILAESLDELAIDPEITPNLYRLKTEGLYFNNYYSPVYNASTADSEFVLNTSLFPSIDYGVAAYNYGNNTYPYTIANAFQKENYFTNSFHSFHSFFYNRENMHTSLGYSTFYDIEKLNLNYDTEGWQEGVDWIDDINLMRNMLNVSSQKDPFFSFVITVSGHLPYNAGRRGLMEYFNQLKEYEYLEPYTFYLSAQKKLDDSIGLLF
jgi:phosphoglycerol transferase MdoB-like AlkP superfamily enzyme